MKRARIFVPALAFILAGFVLSTAHAQDIPPVRRRAEPLPRLAPRNNMPQAVEGGENPEPSPEPRDLPTADDSNSPLPTADSGSDDSSDTGSPFSGKGKISSTPTTVDAAARLKNGRFSFDFAKAELTTIVKAISELMQRNFIVPAKLKGQRITILSPRKVSIAEAYQVFLAALAANEITVVRIGQFYKLVESKQAQTTTIPTCVDSDDVCPQHLEQMVTRLLPMKHVDAEQINGVVKGLISRDGSVTVFAPSNALIISEYAANLTRVQRIISALDIPGFDDELRMVQIEYANASEVASTITQVYEVQAGKAKHANQGGAPGGESEEVSISKVIADERTNQLIIKANKRSFEFIQGLIAKLDVPISDAEQGKVHVYYLENAKSEDLASTLSSLAQGSSGASRTKPGRAGGAAGTPPSGAESAVLFEGEVKITADKPTNSLIVVASPHDYRSVHSIIQKLDRPRRQVFVEAAILEVNASDDDKFGLDWHMPQTFGDSASPNTAFIQSAQSSGGTSPTLSAFQSPAALLTAAGGSVGGVFGKALTLDLGNGGQLKVPTFGVILKWLQTTSRANVLSTPHILTTDNEQATIEVGSTIPFRSGVAASPFGGAGGAAGAAGGAAGAALGGFGSLFSSVNRIDVKLTLNVTPQINIHNRIRLEIDQKIEDVTGVDQSTGQPITSTRAAKTVVVVRDQQTVVIGGLMRDNTTISEGRIPILGSIPILGWLFRNRTSKTTKVNLMLVLTPYIIEDSQDFQGIFERKMAEYDEFAAEYYGKLPRYRSHIDYRKKSGPLALLSSTIKSELERPENGGDGGSDSTIFGPKIEKKKEEKKERVRQPSTLVEPEKTQSAVPGAVPAPAPMPVPVPLIVPVPGDAVPGAIQPYTPVPAPPPLPVPAPGPVETRVPTTSTEQPAEEKPAEWYQAPEAPTAPENIVGAENPPEIVPPPVGGEPAPDNTEAKP